MCVFRYKLNSFNIIYITFRTTGRSRFDPRRRENVSSRLCVRTVSGAHPTSCPVVNGGPFPGGKVWPRRDADHSAASSAEVKNE
jgi:hypothetical protein